MIMESEFFSSNFRRKVVMVGKGVKLRRRSIRVLEV